MHKLFPLVVIFLAACATVQGPSPVVDRTLENGLRVVVKEDHRSPVVTSQVWYRVGSVDERRGITGVSHVLEHMMFKGTERLGPNEFSRIIAENGGRENAFTSRDFTAYHQQLERSRLAIAFDLESDRMRNLTLSEEEFVKEIQVVMEERRLRTDDDPEGLLSEKFMETAYRVSPYRNPIIGWREDLERMTIADVRDWYRRFYAPNNAIVVVVGDVDASRVVELAEEAFGKLPRGEIAREEIPREPPQEGERRTRVQAPAEVPMLMMAYHVPALTPEDDWEPYALAVAAAILDGGDSARFARELVRGQRIAAGASAGYRMTSRQSTLFELQAVPAQGHDVESLERALRDQIARLREQPVTDAELDRVKAQVAASDVFRRDSVFYQAMQLGQLAALGLDLGLLDRYPRRIGEVTPQQVQEVARKYLRDDNLTVGVLEPLPVKPGAKRKSAAKGGNHAR